MLGPVGTLSNKVSESVPSTYPNPVFKYDIYISLFIRFEITITVNMNLGDWGQPVV